MQLKCLGINPVQRTTTICHDEILFIGREAPAILEWCVSHLDLKSLICISSALPDQLFTFDKFWL